jgi:fatty acid desaturase
MFAAVVTIRPFLYFKWRHAEHHTYAQHPTRDPDAVAMPQSFRQYVV